MIKPRYSNFVLLMGEFTCTVPPYQGHRTYWQSSYKTPKHQKSLAFFDSRHRCSHYHFASFTRESRVRHSTSRVQLSQRSLTRATAALTIILPASRANHVCVTPHHVCSCLRGPPGSTSLHSLLCQPCCSTLAFVHPFFLCTIAFSSGET